MDTSYFREFTPKTLKIYADYLRNQGVVGQKEHVTDEDVAMAYSGDTYIKALFEDTDNLVVLSIDSGIQVVNCIAKSDFDSSQSVELQ